MIDHIFNTYSADHIYFGFLFGLLALFVLLQVIGRVFVLLITLLSGKQLGDHPVTHVGVQPSKPWPRQNDCCYNKGNGVIIPYSRLLAKRRGEKARETAGKHGNVF